MSELQVLESPREQASDEIIAWDFNWTDRLQNGQEISSVAAHIVQINNGADETTQCLGAQPSLVGGNHATIVVQALTVGKRYRVTARATFTDGTIQDADLLLDVPH